jgi:hypothetical protein
MLRRVLMGMLMLVAMLMAVLTVIRKAVRAEHPHAGLVVAAAGRAHVRTPLRRR